MNKIFFPFIFYALMALLFVTYAIAMGAGTFIESKYNTDTAQF
jgi:hypothetical protein